MAVFLTLFMVASVTGGVFFTRHERDYGIPLMLWTLAFASSILLYFSIEPNVVDTYVFDPDSFKKVTMATAIVSFVTIQLLSLLVAVNTDRDRKAFERQRRELERLREERDGLREALRVKKDAPAKRQSVIIDLKRNPQ